MHLMRRRVRHSDSQQLHKHTVRAGHCSMTCTGSNAMLYDAVCQRASKIAGSTCLLLQETAPQ